MATKEIKTRSGGSAMDRILPILLVLALLGAGLLYWNYTQAKEKLSVLTDPQQANELSQEQTALLLEKVRKIAVLPDEDNPVVATINDVETLSSNQNFYKDANIGDKLIIFARARHAIIYDEKANRIVNMGPIFYTNSDGENQPGSLVQEGKLAIDLRNGSSTKDLAITTKDRLATVNKAFNVVHLAKAANANYTGITIYDQTDGAKAELIAALQRELGAVIVQTLPAAEADSTAEVVVILGS